MDAMHHMFANRTAAPFSDLDRIVLELGRGREIEILDADGRSRSRSIRRLRPTDQIAFPSQPLLPRASNAGLSVLRGGLAVAERMAEIRLATSLKYPTSSTLSALPNTFRSRYDNHFFNTWYPPSR